MLVAWLTSVFNENDNNRLETTLYHGAIYYGRYTLVYTYGKLNEMETVSIIKKFAMVIIITTPIPIQTLEWKFMICMADIFYTPFIS